MHIITSQLCPNFAQAAQNRQRIAERLYTIGYLRQEAMREGWATGQPKPATLVIGELPTVRTKRLHPFAIWRTTDES